MHCFRNCYTTVTFALVLLVPFAAVAEGDDADKNGPGPHFDDVEQYRVSSEAGVVAADEKRASEVGAEVLEAGGNAADAGAAALLTLGVTNPFGSGLGGGGFCLYKRPDDDEPVVLDFRETAPGDAHRDMYFVDGEADPDLARIGGLAVATPGEPAGIWSLHSHFGDLDFEDVVQPPLDLAADGFEVGATLAERIEGRAGDIEQFDDLAAVLQNENGWLQQGDLMVREDLAETLRIFRDEGVRPFYNGEIADAIAETVQAHDGKITADDLASYQLKRRQPVKGRLGDVDVYSMPPPSSGGIALAQAFNILEQFDSPDKMLNEDPAYLHLVIEALKHAFADRARWLGDSDFVDVPANKLTSTDYARELAERIDPESVLDPEEYGTAHPDYDVIGTAHVSAVDADDNMLACTTTINTPFGSMVVVPDYGLILNNEMADFNVEPGEPNVFGLIGTEQNAVEPGKRPLSSMSPTLVVRDGEPTMTLGASGGPMIISGVYFTILHSLLFDAAPLDAMIAPRMHHQWIPDELRVEVDGLDIIEPLNEKGHNTTVDRIFSAVQFILRDDDTWIGVTDPRKGGIPAAPDSKGSEP